MSAFLHAIARRAAGLEAATARPGPQAIRAIPDAFGGGEARPSAAEPSPVEARSAVAPSPRPVDPGPPSLHPGEPASETAEPQLGGAASSPRSEAPPPTPTPPRQRSREGDAAAPPHADATGGRHGRQDEIGPRERGATGERRRAPEPPGARPPARPDQPPATAALHEPAVGAAPPQPAPRAGPPRSEPGERPADEPPPRAQEPPSRSQLAGPLAPARSPATTSGRPSTAPRPAWTTSPADDEAPIEIRIGRLEVRSPSGREPRAGPRRPPPRGFGGDVLARNFLDRGWS